MTRRNPPARYALPNPVNPASNICFLVHVPREKNHIAAFLGQIKALGGAYAWADDAAHTARLVAAVWLDIFNSLKAQNCEFDQQNSELENDMKLRIDPDNSCIIQCFDECGQTWGTWLDISSCVPGAGSQPGAGGTPATGQTNCYDVLLAGSSQWISPIPIKDGDNIVISGASGGWQDGGGRWACPNGGEFTLGFCGSTITDPGDPNPTIAHQRLIASTNGGASWQDAFNTTLFIAPGQSPTNLLIQMNDGSLPDNGGSINFRVCITTQNATTWSHDIDFTIQSGGFRPRSGQAQWMDSVGWIPATGTPEACGIGFDFLHSNAVLTDARFDFTTDAPHAGYQGAAIFLDTTTEIERNNAIAESPGGALIFSGSSSLIGHTSLDADINVSASLTSLIITNFHAAGTGTNPFI